MPLIRRSADPAPAIPLADSDPAVEIRNDSPDARWAAARALGDAPGGAAVLAAALPQETDVRVREAMLTSLIRHGGEVSVRAIAPLIRSDDAKFRTEALDALRAMPKAIEVHVGDLLGDRDPDVRLLSCDLARVLPAEAASELLVELLDCEMEVNVCAAAIDALAEVGGPTALPALDRLGRRFPDHTFLTFAIRAVAQRIASRPAG